jgi:glutathione S-transferase
MTLILWASVCLIRLKPLIALYERDVIFTFQIVDPSHPENQARIAELSPTGQFPALIDGNMEIAQSNAIIEYLDLFHGEAVRWCRTILARRLRRA